jgi:CBS domain-containing protein
VSDTNVGSKAGNIVTCPSCGEENIEGTDTCQNCMMDLRSIDVPETSQPRSQSDLLSLLEEVRQYRPLLLPPTAPVSEALQLLREVPGAAILVGESLKLILGIFTERDVLSKLAARDLDLNRPVADFMTRDPVVLREDDNIAVAMNKMGDGGFRHIPVVANGEVIGMVTANGLLRWVIARYLN